MKTNEELLKENAELKIKMACIRSELESWVPPDYLPNSDTVFTPVFKVYEIIDETPAQHLADIKLSAQEELISIMRDDLRKHIARASEIGEIDFLLSLNFTIRMIQEYADKLIGESK